MKVEFEIPPEPVDELDDEDEDEDEDDGELRSPIGGGRAPA